ncbi:MAG: hypothetical protein JO022_02250 [Acidobacteriaceae bacterium]|nr:hypothetical protein [Acidobacteriaceae bacterium]
MTPEAVSQTPLDRWTQTLAETARLAEQLRVLIRIANHTNQVPAVRTLCAASGRLPHTGVRVAIVSKPENGASQLVETLQPSELRIQPLRVEAPSFSDIPAERWNDVRSCDAVLVLISAAAPLFDETTEFLGRELAAVKDRVVLVSTAVDGIEPALERGVAAELHEALKKYPALQGVSATTMPEAVNAVMDVLVRSSSVSALDETRQTVHTTTGLLLPFANAFADFLSLTQPQYLRRLEFIHRDLAALSAIADQAKSLLEAQTQKCMADAKSTVQAVTLSMRQQAEAAMQNTPIPREVISSIEARTQFGKSAIGTARAAGYREFGLRVNALAMDLNSTRSLLLSKIDQLRLEAQTHLEELILNIGQGLLPAWLAAAAPAWAAAPLELSLDPGTDFAAKLTTAATQVRSAIAEPQFTSAWASRMEALFRGELANAAVANWTSPALDQPLLSAIALLWKETTERSCGILIGRLKMIVEAVTAGIESSRLGSLELPREDRNREQASHVFRSFAAQLEQMSQHPPA